MKREGKELEQELKNGIVDYESYLEKRNNYAEKMSDIGKSNLAEYVMHRKTILDILAQNIRYKDQEQQKYAYEKNIHQLIFPMTKTSDDIDYLQHIKPELKTEYYNELIDDIQIENARGIIEKQWENVLLAEDGLKSFKEIFDDIFQKCLRIHQDKFFCELEESDVICRLLNDKYPINKERFIPWDNTDTINRWNPPGKTYLYLSYTKVDEQYNSRLKLSEYICLEEYRANKGERYYFCNFRPTKKGHILNLSYNDNSLRTYKNMLINHEADLENKILEEVMNNSDIDKFQSKRKIKRAIKKAQKKYDVDKAIIEESVAKQYLKMICSCIYKKVDEIDEEKREEAYKSFWILANYLEEKGVTGIIYPCTRDRKICGKNIVLFNKYDAEPIESTIREFNY